MEENFSSSTREYQEATPTMTHAIPGGDTIDVRPIIFRNSRFFIAWLMLFGVAGMVIGLTMNLLALQEILTARHNPLLKALNTILWASAGFYTAWLGVSMFRAGLQMTYYE